MKHLFFLLSLLSIVQISIGQSLTEKAIGQLEDLTHDIEVDSDYSNGNWDSVLEAIGEKRTVFLGELNHGSKEIFITRNQLVKALHEKLGFDVILFESGFGEVGAVELQKSNLTHAQMTYGFFSGWRSEEFEQLMGYAKDNGMAVHGFDVQKTGRNFNSYFVEQLQGEPIDTLLYYNIEQRFDDQKRLLSNRKAVYDSLKQSTEALIKDYQNLTLAIQKESIDLSKSVKAFINHTLENRIVYLQYFLEFTKTNDWNKRWRERDFMMASNVEWLVENLYKDRKIIVIGHNFHIAKFNEKEAVMGEFLLKKFGTNRYVLGVFAGSGSYADNSGKEKAMKPIDNDGIDIKAVINGLGGHVNFVDMTVEHSKEIDILYKSIIVNDTFIDLYGSNQMILSKHFDGLLFLDKISPSE